MISNSRHLEVYTRMDLKGEFEYLTTTRGVKTSITGEEGEEMYKCLMVHPNGPCKIMELRLKFLSLKKSGGKDVAEINVLKLKGRLPIETSADAMDNSIPKLKPETKETSMGDSGAMAMAMMVSATEKKISNKIHSELKCVSEAIFTKIDKESQKSVQLMTHVFEVLREQSQMIRDLKVVVEEQGKLVKRLQEQTMDVQDQRIIVERKKEIAALRTTNTIATDRFKEDIPSLQVQESGKGPKETRTTPTNTDEILLANIHHQEQRQHVDNIGNGEECTATVLKVAKTEPETLVREKEVDSDQTKVKEALYDGVRGSLSLDTCPSDEREVKTAALLDKPIALLPMMQRTAEESIQTANNFLFLDNMIDETGETTSSRILVNTDAETEEKEIQET